MHADVYRSLGYTHIGDAGAAALAPALGHLQSLTSLECVLRGPDALLLISCMLICISQSLQEQH